MSRFFVFIGQFVFVLAFALLAAHDKRPGGNRDREGNGAIDVGARVAEAAESDTGQTAEGVGGSEGLVGQEGGEAVGDRPS